MSFGGSLVPSANKLSGSVLNNRLQEPHKMSWPNGFGEGDTDEWYKNQPTTTFTHLQYRKEYGAPFFHEFIVVELDNGTICRFDRRGDPNTRANTFTLEGMTAEDTAHVIQKHEDHFTQMGRTSSMLMRIHFSATLDLDNVLNACYRIQANSKTRAYSLSLHNCYFFSLVITLLTVREGAGELSWDLELFPKFKVATSLQFSLRNLTARRKKIALSDHRSSQPTHSGPFSYLPYNLSRENNVVKMGLAPDTPQYEIDQSYMIAHCKNMRKYGVILDSRKVESTIESIILGRLTGGSGDDYNCTERLVGLSKLIERFRGQAM
ncbi:hypothetical protein FRC07_004645 [Ceratobasidium sp. 392]|nr:hypothetical protein FRC07_004645 [Ceratobasidium sp. 392]